MLWSRHRTRALVRFLAVTTPLVLLYAGCACASSTLFPTDLPGSEWTQFKAAGFSKPACGIIYRLKDKVSCGLALGGIDTGCIDLETSGLLGYCTIFNTLVPRRGPINLPVFGLCVGGKTWVLCDPKQMKKGWGEFQDGANGKPVLPVPSELKLDGVETAKEIHYWGHYPVADMEFETSAPVSVGVRAWSPFLPGDVKDSAIPAIIFEVHLRNRSSSAQKGAMGFSFPGPDPKEAGTDQFDRRAVHGGFDGVSVAAPQMSYALGAIGENSIRTGGELGADGAAWAALGTSLPTSGKQPGASAAVDFSLAPGKEKVVRFVLTWCAPTWKGGGYNWSDTAHIGYTRITNTFTHMYAKFYPDAARTAEVIAKRHAELLKRIIAWQQVIYSDGKLPVWLRDSLINVLYMITEDSVWGQKKPPIADWVNEEDGLFGLNECPRGCPQIECIPCSFYGSLPMTYFFPELELSTLRAYKGYLSPRGAAPFIFGGTTDIASPTPDYHATVNGICLAALVDRYLMCYDTPDGKVAREFYPAIKKNIHFTINLSPDYPIGERIISVGVIKPAIEWFEAPDPGWFGMTAHVGGLHLAQLKIAKRMAEQVGDSEFARQCDEWIKAGSEAMEKNLWTGSYYLNFLEPRSGKRSDLVFGYQLDGEWITDQHGLASALPEDHVRTALETIKRCNIAVTKYGAVNYANADGTPAKVGGYGTYSYFPPEALMLAMNYMYEGERDFGMELARKVWHNLYCLQGYTWDMPNIMRGDADTGERTYGSDYYQDMMLWSIPSAMEGKDLGAPTKTGGLVNRVLRAAKKGS